MFQLARSRPANYRHERGVKPGSTEKQLMLSSQSGTSEIITRPRSLLQSLLKDNNLLYSGAGKTTLMNVLAHRNISQMEVSGTVEVNDHPIGLQINTMSAYIQQEDLFIGSLTVREHLTFQVSLA